MPWKGKAKAGLSDRSDIGGGCSCSSSSTKKTTLRNRRAQNKDHALAATRTVGSVRDDAGNREGNGSPTRLTAVYFAGEVIFAAFVVVFVVATTTTAAATAATTAVVVFVNCSRLPAYDVIGGRL